MRLAIIDLDGVVANSDARFACATTDGRVNWKVAFDPELVALDTLISGADESIKQLAENYMVRFLTSRPEHMRAATKVWLAQFELQSYELTMKPASAQFTKTVAWKAETVTQMAIQSAASFILFIDDEEANRLAVQFAGERLGKELVCLPGLPIQFSEEDEGDAEFAVMTSISIRQEARAMERKRDLTDTEILARVSKDERIRFQRGRVLHQLGAYHPE